MLLILAHSDGIYNPYPHVVWYRFYHFFILFLFRLHFDMLVWEYGK